MKPKVMGFNSLDEMLDEIARSRAVADRETKDWQAQIGPGDCYALTVREPDGLFFIYGEILPWPDDMPPQSEKNKHSRFVRAFSQIEPIGEYGFIHCRDILSLLTREQFDEARRQEWPTDPQGFYQLVRSVPRS